MIRDYQRTRTPLASAVVSFMAMTLLPMSIYASHPQGDVRYSYHASQAEASRACSEMQGLKDNFCGSCIGPMASIGNDVYKYQGVWFHGSGINRVTNCVFFFPIKPCPPRTQFIGPAPGSCR